MDKKTKMKEKKASGIWKKVLGICLAVIMVIGMTMPAWAQIDAESKGSIKVTADESGWTASAYRVIDVNFDFDNQQPKESAYVWNKNAAEWVRTNFKDYIEADGNGVTEAFITTIKLAPCLVRLNTRPLHHIPDLCKPFFSVYASVMSFQFLYIYKSSRLKICPLP